ncbi:hypothetical protein Mal4_40030 [Maioricimonas rarisocia]|uniref:Uncharacterized protein n=1 Tax=Maioricimonas rarisocia TaxID=2528026 RepID=A0A517ZB23_9PLAN|nr:hypothetical protein Mal4_40030 [Maioricimonas rarisocia]
MAASGPLTQCVCSGPGFCRRHQCRKTLHWYRLCRMRADYFQLWEQGRGPGQLRPGEPGLATQVVNFGRAVLKHVANGRNQADTAVVAARLAACENCDSLDGLRRVCREPDCGCFVDRKARWESEDCPRGRWPALESPSGVARTGSSGLPAARHDNGPTGSPPPCTEHD